MKLRHILIIIMAVVILGLCSLATPSAASFFDNFNSENGGNDAGCYTGFANWNVTKGSVDLCGVSPWNFMPSSYGMYVDLDGSSWRAGRMETKTTFGPGSYVVSFDLGGSQRGNTNTVDVYFDSKLATITLGSSVPFTTYTYDVTLVAPAKLVFDEWDTWNSYGGGSINMGLLLDNVGVQTVPLPPTALLLGSGLVGLVLLRRKWSLKK